MATPNTPVPAPPVLDLQKISFDNWLFDVEIWIDFVKERLTEKKIGCFLYQHLKGKALETVRNEVKSADILSENGSKLIIECLKKLYKKDESQSTHDEFAMIMERRPHQSEDDLSEIVKVEKECPKRIFDEEESDVSVSDNDDEYTPEPDDDEEQDKENRIPIPYIVKRPKRILENDPGCSTVLRLLRKTHYSSSILENLEIQGVP